MRNISSFKGRVDYDARFDQLSVRKPDFKSTYSLELGNIALDVSGKELVGIEIRGARQWFADVFGQRINPEELSGAVVGFADKKSVGVLMLSFFIGKTELKKELVLQKAEPVPILASG